MFRLPVVSLQGKRFSVDTSDRACQMIDSRFSHGSIVVNKYGGWKAKVMGVALEYDTFGSAVLWLAEVGGSGRVFCCLNTSVLSLDPSSPEFSKLRTKNQATGGLTPSIITTFKVLKNAKVRCIQTGEKMKANRTDRYRRQRAAGAI